MVSQPLTKFTKALEGHREDLGYNQFWRYTSGRIPKVLRWLAERPDLAQALADDAAELATKTVGVEQIVAGEDTEQAA